MWGPNVTSAEWANQVVHPSPRAERFGMVNHPRGPGDHKRYPNQESLMPMMRLCAAGVVVVACLVAGCGTDHQKKTTQASEAPVEVTFANRADAIALRFPEAVQNVPMTRLEDAVVVLPTGVPESELDYRLDLWVDRDVPNVAVAHVRQKNGSLLRQFAQLRNAAIEATIDGEVLWHPKMVPTSERPVTGTKIEDAESPSKSTEERETQMKTLAGRFAMSGTTIRLDPVYRYKSLQYGVTDGGVFLFMDDTPKGLLVIEAFDYGTKQGWQYRVNRMTSPPGKISFDGQDIRSWEGFWSGPRSDSDEYVEQRIESTAKGG